MAGASLFQVGEDVEFWRVLAHLSILAVVLLVFEYILHCVEHKLARYDKYYHLLQKVYRELMILGFISLVLKILKEVAPIDGDGKPMIAFQVADLIIFGFAIALVLQTLCIFLQLRKKSRKADLVELIATRSLLIDFHKQDTAFNGEISPNVTSSWIYNENSTNITSTNKKFVKQRMLRHFFIRRFGLPQLFPFSKYIRRAQANLISKMIEVELSTWLLVLAVAWGICGLETILDDIKLVKLLVISSWTLVLLHLVVLFYCRWCVHQLIDLAGYSEDKHVLYANLASIAEEELGAWESETADGALDVMNRVHELQEEVEHEHKSARRGLLKSDTGIQLVCVLCRKLWKTKRTETILKTPPSDNPPISNDVKIRFYSADVWHVVVMLLLTLNGFFVALFIQCALYNLDEIYDELGLIVACLIPLPMLLNALVLQQHIFRDFSLVCSVLHLDANTLGDVSTHFIETVELQSQFAASVLQCLKDGGLTIAYMETVVQSHDLNGSGLIEVDNLRAIMASVGFSLTRFRFNSVVKLLFDLKGTNVLYIQLFQLLALVQQDNDGGERRSGFPDVQRRSTSFEDKVNTNSISAVDLSSIQQFALLAQSSVASDLANSDFAFLRTASPTLRRGSTANFRGQQLNTKEENQVRRSMLQRSNATQFAGSSSRALHYMYNIRELTRLQDDLTLKNLALV
ncbi:hypothetical protein PHMEG_0004875 [Phytophthora megakarya]|uniref:EF-hand domain-containing protein n=1 Tax=Phytophthora megakarya TaxID=4795 RepID=A0A225WST6_9STRA|nr:hypothetical protein PHMEG_0004875 [Phytophthora megakarya]